MLQCVVRQIAVNVYNIFQKSEVFEGGNFLCKQINYIEQYRTECNLFMKYRGVFLIHLKKLIKC